MVTGVLEEEELVVSRVGVSAPVGGGGGGKAPPSFFHSLVLFLLLLLLFGRSPAKEGGEIR